MSLAFDDPLIKFTNFKFTFCTALELNIQGVSEFGANIWEILIFETIYYDVFYLTLKSPLQVSKHPVQVKFENTYLWVSISKLNRNKRINYQFFFFLVLVSVESVCQISFSFFLNLNNIKNLISIILFGEAQFWF